MRAAITVLLLALAGAAAARDYSWPPLVVPPGAVIESPGESIAINGMPVKIARFRSARDAEALTREFEKTVSSGFTRRAPGAADPRTTLGGRIGDFWLTLQIAPLPGGGSQATWSASPRFVPGVQMKVVRPPGFPRSAELLQQVDSFDDGKNSQLAIGLDAAATDAVAARMQEELREAGYVKQAMPRRNWSDDGQFSAIFVNGREELVVSLRPEGAGTSIVINRISALERLQ
jgi:hypothetical protein